MKKIWLSLFIVVFGFSISIAQVASFDFTEVCLGDTTILTNTSTSTDSIIKIEWDLIGNGEFTDANGEIVKHFYNLAGIHTIGLRVTTIIGGFSAIYQQVNVGSFPNANFSVDNTCSNDFTEFTNLSTSESNNLSNYVWYYGDGMMDNLYTNPHHWYTSPGLYNVKLIAITEFGCRDSISKQIDINNIPLLRFEYIGDTVFEEGGEVIVTAIGDFDQIIWSTDDTTSSIRITTNGSYSVQAFNGACPTTRSFTIIVNDRIGVSNLITPNGDGYNDYWKIFHIEDHAPCQVEVYSRDGVKVFSSSNYNNNWNGTFNGYPLAEGSYIYIAICKDDIIQKGTLNIIR